MGQALEEKAAAAEAAAALAAEMKAAVQQSLKEKGEAVERAAAEAEAAGAAKSAAEQEKARAALEVKAAKAEVRLCACAGLRLVWHRPRQGRGVMKRWQSGVSGREMKTISQAGRHEGWVPPAPGAP